MNRQHDIEGLFHLYETRRNGLQIPVFSGVRPLHKLYDNYFTSGQHEYPAAEKIMPGETARALVWLITPDVYPGSLWVGREIDVVNGMLDVIGKLTVEKILNPVLCGSPETYSSVWIEPPNLASMPLLKGKE